jgi:hypothetical protein
MEPCLKCEKKWTPEDYSKHMKLVGEEVIMDCPYCEAPHCANQGNKPQDLTWKLKGVPGGSGIL